MVAVSTHELSVERREKARRLIAEGRSRREVADVLGVHVATIDRYRRHFGIPRAHAGAFRWTPEREHQARLLVEDECPLKEIARTLGTDYRVIWRRFRDVLPPMQPGGDRFRSHRRIMAELGLGLTPPVIATAGAST